MTLPESTQRSLERLQELERLSDPDYKRPRTWRSLLSLKSENLFFLTLITTLICLSCLMVLFINDQGKREKLAKEREKQASQAAGHLQTREIPLGSFESISRSAGDDGNVSVLQYEAFITTNNLHGPLGETESLCYQHQNRLRATVEMVMHKAEDEELKEPSLQSIRQSLVEELNEVVGTDRVQDVQFSNFLHFRMPDTR